MRTDLLKVYILFLILFFVMNVSNIISTHTISGKAAIIIAIIWLIVSTALYFIYMRKKDKTRNKYTILLYSIVNAIIGGIAVSSYYSIKNVTPYNPFIIIALFVALLLGNYCVLNVIKNKILFSGANLFLTIFLSLFAYSVWFDNQISLRSSLIFMLIVYLCFSVSQFMVIKMNLDLNNIIPLSSLLMFGGLVIIAIAMITDGEGLNFFDIIYSGEAVEQKKKVIS